MISEIQVSGEEWKKKHKRIIGESYRKAPFFSDYFPDFFEQVYGTRSNLLIDYNTASIDFYTILLGIRPRVVRMSTLDVDPSLKKTELLVALVKAVGGATYLSGDGARTYLDDRRFEAEGVTLAWHDFRQPSYRQMGKDFIPYLSILDYVFNVGCTPW